MDSLANWFLENDLTTNPTKTKIIRFYITAGHTDESVLVELIKLKSKFVEQLKIAKLLGAPFDQFLNWNEQVDFSAKKITSNYFTSTILTFAKHFIRVSS